MNVTSCGNSDAGAPVAALETLPSLQRACATILRVAARLPPALAAARNSVGLSETLREIALSIAAADRLFTGFVCEALTAAGLNVSSFLPLDELLQKLQTEVPAERAGKLLPPGGLVSILYHLEGQLAEVDAGLLALSPDARHTEPAKQSFNLRPQTTMAFLQLAIAAAVALPFVRPFVALITALLWPLAWPVRHWRRRATHARLRHASDQLTCLVRIWTVAHGTIPLHSMGISHDSSHASAASSSSASSRSTTRSGAMASHVPGRSGGWGSSVSTHPGHAAYSSASGSGSGSGVVRRVSFADAEAAAAGDSDSRASGLEGLGGEVAASSSLAAMASVDSIRRARSYLTLVAEPTRHDFEPGSKAVARRLLESASLPRGAAVWPTRTWRNAALKRVLDLIYASTAGPAHLLHPNPVTGAQPGLMQLSLFAVSSLLRAAYFAACPLQASEAAGRALQAPSIPLLTWLWRASDSPFMRRMAMAKAKARGLAVCQEVWVGGVHTMLMCRDSDPALDAACAAAAQPGGEPDSEVRHHADGAPFVIPQLPTHRGASMSAHPPLSSSGSSGSSGSADDGGDGLQSLASERGRGASLVEAEFDESHLRSASSSGGGAGAHRRRHHHRDGNKKLHPPGSEDVVDDPAADPAHRDASGPSIASHDVTTLTRPVSSAASHTRTGALPSRLPRALMHINGGGFVGRSFAPDVDMLAEWAMTAPSPSLASSTSGPRGHSAAAAAASAGPLLIAYPRYSLSPEVTFPTALLELVRVYIWLRERCETVVVSGESAGGNLAAALSIYCLWHGLPLPDALVLAYPALVLNPSPSPSRALHLNDPLVPAALLMAVGSCYTGYSNEAAWELVPPLPVSARSNAAAGGSSSRSSRSSDFGSSGSSGGSAVALPRCGATPGTVCDCVLADGRFSPLVHPGYASDADLARFPRTFLLAGGLDPLLDDAVDFHTRLRRAGVPGDLRIHRHLPHGFLYFPHVVQGAREARDGMRGFVYECLGLLRPAVAAAGAYAGGGPDGTAAAAARSGGAAMPS